MFKVFVYGTLKSACSRGVHFEKDRIACEDAVVRNFDLYDVLDRDKMPMFPAVLPGKGRVYGELHTYRDNMLARFDAIEGYIPGQEGTNLYNRRTVKVATVDFSREEEAYIYVFNENKRSHCRKTATDTWAEHHRWI